MNRIDKWNLDKLVKVECRDFCPSLWHTYHKGKQKKYFWQEEIKKGFYTSFVGYRGLKTPENCTLIDGKVFNNPCVTMIFVNKEEFTKYFETHKEAKEFAESITKGKNWLLN